MEDGITVRRAAAALVALAALLVGGTVGFHLIAHESWIAAFYRTVVTASLTGLDSVPGGVGAKLLTIALVLTGVALLAYVGSVVVEAIARGVLGGAWAEKKRRRAIESLHDHYIICGYGRVGRRVAEEFAAADAPFVVLDFSAEAIAAAREEQVLLVEGSGEEDADLTRAGIARARGLVAASDDDAANLYITLSAKSQRPDLVVVARASDEEAEKKIRLAGADRVVTPYTIAGRVMANLMIKPQVAAFLNVVSRPGGPDLSIEQIEVRPGCGQEGKSIGELRVQERTGAYIAAVRRQDGSFDTRPSADSVLSGGDVLVGVGRADEIRALEELFAPREAVAG
ncbi:MAG TPA: TrkA family potassium uptake protein [Gaiellaceae bacterium]